MNSKIARNPLASKSYDLTVATPIGTACIERRFNLLTSQQHTICSISTIRRTQSISRFSSSSVALGKATLYMVVREMALVS